MMLTVIIKTKYIFGVVTLGLCLFSLVIGQEKCMTCSCVTVCCDIGDPICYGGKDPVKTKCMVPENIELLSSGSKEDEKKFDALYASKLFERKISVKDLEDDKALREALKSGTYTTDDKTISFTPIEKVKESVRKDAPQIYRPGFEEDRYIIEKVKGLVLNNSPQIDLSGYEEDRFTTWTKRDGFDEAIRNYRRRFYISALGGDVAAPVRPDFFLNLGRELIQKNRVEEAINFFMLNVEINNSSETQIELDKARIRLADIFIEKGEKDRAKDLLIKIRDDDKTDEKIKKQAIDKLKRIN